jgi:hypothetical protein
MIAAAGLIRKPPNRRKAEVDGGGGVVRLFEVDPVAVSTVLLKASRGSEQYQSRNSRMA